MLVVLSLVLSLPLISRGQGFKVSASSPTLTSPTGKVMDISMGVGRGDKIYKWVKRPDQNRRVVNFYEHDTLTCQVSVVQYDQIRVVNGFVVRDWVYFRERFIAGAVYPDDYFLLDIKTTGFLSIDRKTVLTNTYPDPAWYKIGDWMNGPLNTNL